MASPEVNKPADAASDSEESFQEIYIVSAILDVKAFPKEKVLKYKVRWEGYTADDDTWQTEETLTESPLVENFLKVFKEDNAKKMNAATASLKASISKKSKRRQTWEYVNVEEEPDRTDLTTPREFDESDEFFGEVAGTAKGEAKKLFDPTHKNSATELLLAQLPTNERMTRRKVKDLIYSGSSRNSSISRDSASPSPSSSNAKPIISTKGSRKRPVTEKKEDGDVKMETDTGLNSSNEAVGTVEDDNFQSLFSGIAIHRGPIDLEEIHREYQSVLEQTEKKLDPASFRFGKDYIRLFSDKSVRGHPIEVLFKNLSVAQLNSVVHYREEGTGYSLLHWVCANMPCDGAHTADQVAQILCMSCTTTSHIISTRDVKLNIPLHVAVTKLRACLVGVLLNQRTPLNVHNIEQKTPLMLAYENNNVKILKLLLHAGADFYPLQDQESRKPKEMVKKRSLDIIIDHCEVVRQLFTESRKNVLSQFEEVLDYRCPIRLGLVSEGPCLKFELSHEDYVLPSADYGYILALHICCLEGADVTQWTARCWGGLKMQSPPIFNGRNLMNDAAQAFAHPMVFFVNPVPGNNTLELHITPNELHYDVLGCQLALIRFAPEYHEVNEVAARCGEMG